MSSKYQNSATDGLPCRVSGTWAQDKLHYVAKYMEIFNGSMKKKWPQRAFIDLMAGPGRCVLDNSDEEFDGSPLIALKTEPQFTSVLLVESDATLLAALAARTVPYGTRATSIHGDCNDPAVIATIRKTIPGNALALAFVDMLGLDVAFDTLRGLTVDRKIDLAITFQVNDLVRNVPQVMKGLADGARLDSFFGTPLWRDVVALAERGELRTNDIREALTDYYCDRLKTLGYAAVARLHLLMKNTRNAPLYRLLLAGKHERAAEFFRKVSTKIEHTGQRGLGF